MAAVTLPIARRRDWRVIVFRVVAGLVALFFLLISAPALLLPWVMVNIYPDTAQNPGDWRWYGAIWGAYGSFLVAGSLLALLRRPREQPLLMQFWLLGQIIVTASWLTATWPAFEFDEIVIIAVILPLTPRRVRS